MSPGASSNSPKTAKAPPTKARPEENKAKITAFDDSMLEHLYLNHGVIFKFLNTRRNH